MDQVKLDLPWLPQVTRVVFERSPLALALCQVRFASVLNIANPVFVAPFQQEIQSRYPIGGQQTGVELEFKPEEAEVKQRASPSFQWRFVDQEDNWTVILAQNFLAIETRAYVDFSDFLDRLRQALKALVQHINPRIVTRLGLRYVNEIRPGNLAWAKTVRRELLGPLGVEGLRKHTYQSLQQVWLRYPDNHGINIRHGLLPSSTTIKPRRGEASPSQPFYLLDIDVFREIPKPADLVVNPDSICRCIDSYNDVVYRLFRWAVTEQYVSTLGIRQ